MDIATLGLVVRSDGVVVASDRLNRLEKEAGRVEGTTSKVTRSFGALQAAAVGLFAALSVGALAQMSSAWTDMTSRVNIAAGSMESGTAVMGRLEQMARRTYSSLSQTAESYLLNATALRELGYSTTQQLDFTEALNNALVVSGAKGQRAASVMNALSKAMAIGELRGEELNTVIQSGGRVSQALADALGVATTDLRKMGQESKLTGDVVFNALTSQLQQLRDEADSMPATIGDAFLLMGNSVLAFVGRLDQATGASSNIAGVIIGLADAISAFTSTAIAAAAMVSMGFDALAPVLSVVGAHIGMLANLAPIAVAAISGFFAPAVIAGLATVTAAIGVGMVGAVRALTAAMLANPMGLLIGGITAAVTAAFIFRDEIKNVIGVDVVSVMKDAANAIIGAFDLAFRNVQTIWSMLPGALGDFAIQTANAVLKAMEGMINGSIQLLNDFTAGARDALGAIGIEVGAIGKVDFGEVSNPYAGADRAMGQQLAANKASVMSTDYIGELTSAMGKAWETAQGTTTALDELAASLDGGGGGSGGGAGGAGGGGGSGGVAGAAKAANDNFGGFLDQVEEGQAVFEATRTPIEQMIIDLGKLDQQLATGVISWDTYARAASSAVANAASSTLGALANLSSGLSQAFEENKALSIATAVLKGAEAVASAFAAGNSIGGPFVGAAFAAVAAMTAAANVAAVASTTQNSKSMKTGGSTRSPSIAAAAPTPGKSVNIVLHGKGRFDRDDIITVIRGIEDVVGDGVNFNFVEKSA